MCEIRTRFAPSPTGFMHVGNLRTALYAWLLARSGKGSFVLRIEDTDQNRYVEGAVDIIYSTLKQAGIDHDEGPDNGGNYGPYIQSERKALYKEYAEKLVELGAAYYCFCAWLPAATRLPKRPKRNPAKKTKLNSQMDAAPDIVMNFQPKRSKQNLLPIRPM